MLANIKSSIKRIRIAKTKTLQNQMVKSALKSSIKTFEAFIVEGNVEEANTAFKQAVKKIDQAVAKGVLHKNTAARKKSQLSKKLNSVTA